MTTLMTRCGKPVRDIGTWERAQLKEAAEAKPLEPKIPSSKGVRYNKKTHNYRPHYAIRPYAQGKFQRITRVYLHHHDDNVDAAYAVATKIYNLRMKSFKLAGKDLSAEICADMAR